MVSNASIRLALCLTLCLCGPCAADPGQAALLKKFEELEQEVQKLRSKSEFLQAENAEIKEELRGVPGRRLFTDAWASATTASIAENTVLIETTTADLQGALDHMWLLLCGALVMFMQAGFAMVEAGSCRVKNVQNILLKNLVDVCMGTICWWAFGWTLAYGFDADDPGKFAGNQQYFGHEFLEADADGNQTPTNLPRDWFFQWAFCSAASTIVSGGVAERVKFPGYLIYTVLMTTIIYPVVVGWTWSGAGWLAPGESGHINDVGYNDFAGSGIVHLSGGTGALVGAILVGPRVGRFDRDEKEFRPHSMPLIVLGTFILWFGWYGFNCGSTLGLSSTTTGQLAAQVAMNTTISASIGGLVVLLLRFLLTKTYDVGGLCNGILGGLVSITAGCGNLDCGSAFLTGIIGGCLMQGTSMLLKKLHIDDPVDAFAVHGACGAWGVLAAALFDWGKGADYYNGFGGGLSCTTDADGNCMSGAFAKGLAANVVEIIAIVSWVGGLSGIIFFVLRLTGLLKASEDDQEQGMDVVKHSPSKAYE